MRIYIPTAGRVHAQRTVQALGPELCAAYRATLVCPKSEAATLLRNYPGIGVVTFGGKGMGSKRQHILDNSDDQHVLMLDDDLGSWSARIESPDGSVRYLKATQAQIRAVLRSLPDLLRTHGHGCIGHRLFANSRPAIAHTTRHLRALAYDRDYLHRTGVKFRLPLMEDFDVQLQLMAYGAFGFQLNTITHEQTGSNSSGGCSAWRTPALQAATAAKLVKLHPHCVSVVQKRQKNANGGWGTRTDVRINWAKAVCSSY